MLSGICILVLTFLIVRKTGRDERKKRGKRIVEFTMSKSDSFYFSREHIGAMLSKYGGTAFFEGFTIEPEGYLIFKFLLSLLLFMVGVTVGPTLLLKCVLGAVFAIAVFFSIDKVLVIANASDNEEMMPDIQLMYEILRVQTRAGVFFKQSLQECFYSVKNRRLKKALKELNDNIFMGIRTPAESVDIFNSRFCNDQIDNLCAILKQGFQTGRMVEILNDVEKQIQDTQRVAMLLSRDRTERRTLFIEVAFFGVIILLCVYIVGAQAMEYVKFMM